MTNPPAESVVYGGQSSARVRVHHLQQAKERGEKWAMLTAYDTYSAAIFEEAGIPTPGDDWARPWTWEQFTDALRRTTTRRPDGEPERYGYTDLGAYHRWLVTNGARLTNEEETRTLYDSPEAIETWEWLYDLLHGHKVAQSPLTHRELAPNTAFISGKAVTWVTSTAGGMSQLVPQK